MPVAPLIMPRTLNKPSGNGSGLNIGSSVAPLQVGLIGSIGILALPFELTEVTGLLLQHRVAAELSPADQLVIAPLSNDYLRHVTTERENNWTRSDCTLSSGQCYEASSTWFGPSTASVVR